MTPRTGEEQSDVEQGVPVDNETKNVDDESSEHSEIDRLGRRYFIFLLISNIFFVLGSITYVYLAAVGLQYEKKTNGIPADVLEADDWVTWWPYYQSGKYTDDYVFETNSGTWVSRYQIIYAAAAFCFIITGLAEFVNHPGILSAMFVLAGAFGFTSAAFVESNVTLAIDFNLVSIHLFVVEAVLIFFRRDFYGGIKHWMRFADGCFVVGTISDLVLAWIVWTDKYNMKYAKVGVFAAVMWLLCSVVLFGSTIYIRKHAGFEEAVEKHRRDSFLGEKQETGDYSSEESDD